MEDKDYDTFDQEMNKIQIREIGNLIEMSKENKYMYILWKQNVPILFEDVMRDYIEICRRKAKLISDIVDICL